MQNRAAHCDECAALSMQLDGSIGEISQCTSRGTRQPLPNTNLVHPTTRRSFVSTSLARATTQQPFPNAGLARPAARKRVWEMLPHFVGSPAAGALEKMVAATRLFRNLRLTPSLPGSLRTTNYSPSPPPLSGPDFVPWHGPFRHASGWRTSISRKHLAKTAHNPKPHPGSPCPMAGKRTSERRLRFTSAVFPLPTILSSIVDKFTPILPSIEDKLS